MTVTGAFYDGGENGAGSAVAGKASLAHIRPSVYDDCSNVPHCSKKGIIEISIDQMRTKKITNRTEAERDSTSKTDWLVDSRRRKMINLPGICL